MSKGLSNKLKRESMDDTKIMIYKRHFEDMRYSKSMSVLEINKGLEAKEKEKNQFTEESIMNVTISAAMFINA